MSDFTSSLCQTQTGYQPAITGCCAGGVISQRGEYALPNTLAANDMVFLVPLPPEHIPVACMVDCDQLDTNVVPTNELDIGIINTAGNAIDTVFLDDCQVGRVGGVAQADQKAISRVTATSTLRYVGVKVTTVAATKAAGTIGITLMYKPA